MAELTSQDETIRQGDDIVFTMTVRDRNGSAVDITGFSAIEYRLARFSSSDEALISKSLGSGVAISDGPSGQATVTLDPADTQNLVGDYYHNAIATDSAGKDQTVFVGVLTVQRVLT